MSKNRRMNFQEILTVLIFGIDHAQSKYNEKKNDTSMHIEVLPALLISHK